MNDDATSTNVIVGYTNKNSKYNHYKKPPTSKDRKKMVKGNPINVIKVALNLLRRKGEKTSKNLSPSLSTSTNATLTNLVGAIRPLHLQRDIGDMSSPPPPPQLLPGHGMAEMRLSLNERFEVSPCHPKYYYTSSSSSSSSSHSSYYGGMSRYASAQSLYDLDSHKDDFEEDGEKNKEEGMMSDGDAYYDGLEGDEMIDAKADIFIAKFYQQMRLQDF